MAPILVLLPGMDGTGRLFRPFLEVVGNMVSCEIVSYPATEVLNYEELTQLVQASVPKNRPYVLVAESFSGPIGLRLAEQKPDGLVGLILVATFCQNPIPLLRFVPALLRERMSVPPEWVIRHFLVGRNRRELASEVLSCVSSVSPKVLASRVQSVLSEDRLSRSRAIDLPVLYVKGSRDRIVRRSAAKRIRERCVNFQFAEVTAPHLVLQVAPVSAWNAIQVFLADRITGSSPVKVEGGES